MEPEDRGSPGADAAQDWFDVAFERVQRAAVDARAALDATIQAIEEGRRARHRPALPTETVDTLIGAGSRDSRLQASEAFHEFERATRQIRCGLVRELVDDQGLTLTETARRLRISRQAAGRLYAGSGDPRPGELLGRLATDRREDLAQGS